MLLEHNGPATPTDPATAEVTPAVDGDGPTELDVRALAHGARHEVIFGMLERLAVGATFVIRNDHDPRPLRYQTEALWPGALVWTYLESGPAVWRVAITRAA